MTVQNQEISIPILDNDIISGPLTDWDIVIPAIRGRSVVNPDNTISYLPERDKCGYEESFTYFIETIAGRDTATVTVEVKCDDISILTGFSPNNDNVNDFWIIPGIENFPNNTVIVYNRWGNIVLEEEGYTNLDPWDGRWKSRELPDGTYFYIVRDGNGRQFTGWLELRR